MSSTPIVLVDMDGVVAEFEAEFWERWLRAFPDGPTIAEADRTVMDLDARLPEQWSHDVRALLATPGFYAALLPSVGAAQALNEMLALGWEVFLCTAPLQSNPTCASDKLAWAEKHLGPGWARRVIITKDKGLVRGDVLIDDKPALKSIVTPTWTHVVFDQSYNQDSAAAHRLHRWADWREVLTPLVAQNA